MHCFDEFFEIRELEFPSKATPAVTPPLCHRDYQANLQRFIAKILESCTASILPFHCPDVRIAGR